MSSYNNSQGYQQSGYQELEEFDRTYEPKSGQRPGLETLSDGDYNFTIVEAELDRTPKTKELILKVALRVDSPGVHQGTTVERTYFFRNQENVDRLGGDLCTLGFDADQWSAATGRKFSVELPRVVPHLKGIRFVGKKTAKEEDPLPGQTRGKVYHNLYVNARLSGGSMPPASQMPPSSPPRQPAQTPAFVPPAGALEDSIPF